MATGDIKMFPVLTNIAGSAYYHTLSVLAQL